MTACNWHHRGFSAFIFAFFLLQVIGCSTNRATYFRKHGAGIEEERGDWEKCGGGFFKNGALKPIVSQKVYSCMKEKGYILINDYYEEELYSWLKADYQDGVFFEWRDLMNCGARRFGVGLLCKSATFILKSEFSSVNKCMEKKGYILVPPRNSIQIRVFDKLADIDKNFCLYLTPVNKKGAVSFGNRRIE